MIIKNPARILRKLSLSALSLAMFAGTAATPALAQQWATSGSNIYNTNTGNVGIGTTTPGKLIDAVTSIAGGQAALRLTNTNNTNSASQAKVILSVGGTSAGDPLINFNVSGSQDWIAGVDTSDSRKFKIANTTAFGGSPDRLTINTSGNVGIGTTNPTALLSVGSTAINANSLNKYQFGYGYAKTDTTLRRAGTLAQSNESSQPFSLYTAVQGGASDYLRYALIQTGVEGLNNSGYLVLQGYGGNVGIGTTTPAQSLEVNGRIRMATWTADGTTVVYKNASGDIGIQSSDLRLKKNIAPISDSLAKIAGINGVLFNWKTESDDAKKTVGVIAQDVMKVLPEATFTFKNDKGEELYGVHYEKLTALLIQGVKDQQKQIDELRKEIEELKKSR